MRLAIADAVSKGASHLTKVRFQLTFVGFKCQLSLLGSPSMGSTSRMGTRPFGI